jgi:hypothetical protein
MMNTPELSTHARRRACQRNFSEESVRYILRHGTRVHSAGAIFYQMRKKDLPKADRSDEQKCKLVGSEVVVCRCQQVILTVYHARDLGKSRRKQKYNLRNTCSCPYCEPAHH